MPSLANWADTCPAWRRCVDYQVVVGLASPMDFNGMVRHYFLRKGPHVADIRVNLAPKEVRQQQSHEILLRIRNDLTQLARDTRREHQTGRSTARPARPRHHHGRGLRPGRYSLWRTDAGCRAVAARMAREPRSRRRRHERRGRFHSLGLQNRQAQSRPLRRLDETYRRNTPTGPRWTPSRSSICSARSIRCGSNSACHEPAVGNRRTERASTSAASGPDRPDRRPGEIRSEKGRDARGRQDDLPQEPQTCRICLRRSGRPPAGRRDHRHASRPPTRSSPCSGQRTAAGQQPPVRRRPPDWLSPGGGDPWSIPPATRSNGPARANGRSRWTCSATWGWRSPRRRLGIFVILMFQTRLASAAAGHHAGDPADHDRHHARLLAAQRACQSCRSAAIPTRSSSRRRP